MIKTNQALYHVLLLQFSDESGNEVEDLIEMTEAHGAGYTISYLENKEPPVLHSDGEVSPLGVSDIFVVLHHEDKVVMYVKDEISLFAVAERASKEEIEGGHPDPDKVTPKG